MVFVAATCVLPHAVEASIPADLVDRRHVSSMLPLAFLTCRASLASPRKNPWRAHAARCAGAGRAAVSPASAPVGIPGRAERSRCNGSTPSDHVKQLGAFTRPPFACGGKSSGVCVRVLSKRQGYAMFLKGRNPQPS
jgi:hypothetical protein